MDEIVWGTINNEIETKEDIVPGLFIYLVSEDPVGTFRYRINRTQFALWLLDQLTLAVKDEKTSIEFRKSNGS